MKHIKLFEQFCSSLNEGTNDVDVLLLVKFLTSALTQFNSDSKSTGYSLGALQVANVLNSFVLQDKPATMSRAQSTFYYTILDVLKSSGLKIDAIKSTIKSMDPTNLKDILSTIKVTDVYKKFTRPQEVVFDNIIYALEVMHDYD